MVCVTMVCVSNKVRVETYIYLKFRQDRVWWVR